MLFVPWRVRTNGILSRTLYSHIRVQLWNWFTFSPTFNFFVKKFLAIYRLTKLSRYLDRISNLQETARRISRAKFPGAIYSCSARDTATGSRRQEEKSENSVHVASNIFSSKSAVTYDREDSNDREIVPSSRSTFDPRNVPPDQVFLTKVFDPRQL